MYTNETAHFGIPLPLGSDLTTPMDYNTAAEAVDEALFEAQGDATAANENAAAAVETANATAEALDTLSATVGGHTSQISALGARMTNAENNIDDVRSDLEDMIVAFNEPTATSTHAYAIGDYFIYNDVLYKAIAAIAVGDTIVPNTNCSATNVMTEVSAGGGGSTPTAADISLAPIAGMTADDVQEGIAELKSDLADVGLIDVSSWFTAATNITISHKSALLDPKTKTVIVDIDFTNNAVGNATKLADITIGAGYTFDSGFGFGIGYSSSYVNIGANISATGIEMSITGSATTTTYECIHAIIKLS